MKDRSLLSTKEFNQFSINNGLGTLMGSLSREFTSPSPIIGRGNFSSPEINSQMKLLTNYQNISGSKDMLNKISETV